MPAPTLAAMSYLTVVYAVCTFTLWIRLSAAVFLAIDPVNRPPEDAMFGRPPIGVEGEDNNRRKKVVANDAENVLVDLIVFWGAYVLQQLIAGVNGQATCLALTILFPIYTFARCMYIIMYYNQLQPGRTICFVTGKNCAAAAGCILLANAAYYYQAYSSFT